MTTVVMPDGRMSTMASTGKMMSDAMMKDSRPMTTTHMMMSGGKVYMMEDKKNVGRQDTVRAYDDE